VIGSAGLAVGYSAQIADSALEDGQMQLSPTAAHISHSVVQPVGPQVSHTVE